MLNESMGEGDAAYAKRVLLTAAGDDVSRGIASTLATHGCRYVRTDLLPRRALHSPSLIRPLPP
jgi:hypothetical protein